MTEKIFDILPRKEKEKKVFFPKKRKIEIKFPKSLTIGIFVLGFFLVAFFVSTEFSKAKVEIWPSAKEKTFEDKIILNVNQEGIDFQKKEIGAKIFEIEKEIQEEFKSTGKKLKKAEGKIRLFNSYTTQQEVWRAHTRFMSSEGKLFLSKNRIIVPPAKMKEGKLEPSFVDVEVIAEKGGSDYNIGPSKFSVVAFKGTERYFKYWGESFEPMKGGGEISVVKKEDLEGALDSLVKKIETEKGEEILKEQVPEGFIFPKNAVSVEILEKEFNAKEGDEVEKFTLKIKAKIKTVIFEKEKLKKFLENQFYSTFGADKMILPETEKIEISASILNFQEGKFLVALKDSIKVLPKIEESLIKKEIAGKKIHEAKSKLSSLEEIEKVKITTFPFWSSKIPENLEQIEVFIH
jgi:hypothetical protein